MVLKKNGEIQAKFNNKEMYNFYHFCVVSNNYHVKFCDLWSRRLDLTKNYWLIFSYFVHVCVFRLVFMFREFRVILREDPDSIFSPNVEIENTDGPIKYDVSRIYSGTLEGDIKKNQSNRKQR